MNVEKIEKLEEVIFLDKNQTIVNYNIKRLTAAGENYGSLMLSVDITVRTESENEEIYVVAKMVPPNDFIQEIFNTQVTFKNEIGFYKNIVPTLREFQREQGMNDLIDFFPKYFGSRINLTGDPNKVDGDAILLLENLKLQNYGNLEREVGFDLEAAKLVLIDLAHLHAVPLALKLKKPEVFEKEVKKFLTPLPMKESKDFQQKLLRAVKSVDECQIYFERVEETINSLYKLTLTPREPFATISHNDCWVNNTMVKLEQGKPLRNKLVDFQVLDYGSPAKDLIFFIFSSVQNQVLEEHTDYLIKFYYETFIDILTELKCPVTKFNYEAFLKELETEAKFQFLHVLFMFFPIFAPKGSVKELSELKPEDFTESIEVVTEEHKKKLILVVREFAERKWI